MNEYTVTVGMGSCGIAAGAQEAYDIFKTAERNNTLSLGISGCAGMCFAEPLVEVCKGEERRLYGYVDAPFAEALLKGVESGTLPDEKIITETPDGKEYLGKQVKVALRRCGVINPESIDAYIADEGYDALKKCIREMTPTEVQETVKESGLAGRGGGFFPTGMKWSFLAAAKGDIKYLVCNADEGDPGAFMDRAMIEGDPHGLIEGMTIAAYATRARYGYIYCRAEYPLAIKRLKKAIPEAKERNLLGEKILGSDFSFDLKIKEGAGAFVCGEETALMASIMGERGMPRLRPPFPAEAGLFGKPTNINNVETYENVPFIINKGPEAFNRFKCGRSTGTKVFALAGKIKRVGLVEIPVGLTLREVVEEVGGGSSTGKPIKAVQMGGPAGGCIPARLFDTTIDADSVNATGAIMGSGGLIVMDESTCMVDVARYFLAFTQAESCGKCTFCRIGTRRMLEMLERITAGEGREKDLDLLEELALGVRKSSLCGLGQLAPNPVLTTLKYFREEYLAHINEKRCPAGACKALITYSISEKCIGCTACSRACPVSAISGEKKQMHTINSETCTRCGMCLETCKFSAIDVA